jgi:RNA polymerase sigma factor (TIGR02999 family)
MSEQRRERVTAALHGYLDGRPPETAGNELMALVYDDLRRLAGTLMRGERSGHLLSPTDLVHEAYTRLVDQTRVEWKGRSHFFAIAAQAMRRILVDHARRQSRVRHGSEWRRVTLTDAVGDRADGGLDAAEVLALDQALTKLAAIDPREARVVELRFFVGLSCEEIAEFLEISTRSVTRDWIHARSWLRRELATAAFASGERAV